MKVRLNPLRKLGATMHTDGRVPARESSHATRVTTDSESCERWSTILGVMNAIARGPVAIVGWLCFILCGQVPAQQAPEPSFKVAVKVNVVLVPVIVRDAQGHAVGDLRKEDFQVFDQNRPRVISEFTVEKRAAVANDSQEGQPVPAVPSVTLRRSTPPERFTVLLFDDLHLSASDLHRMQMIATRVLAGSLADSDVAAVVSTSGASSGLTRDRDKLKEAITNLKA
jgi:hypothetical protein